MTSYQAFIRITSVIVFTGSVFSSVFGVISPIGALGVNGLKEFTYKYKVSELNMFPAEHKCGTIRTRHNT